MRTLAAGPFPTIILPVTLCAFGVTASAHAQTADNSAQAATTASGPPAESPPPATMLEPVSNDAKAEARWRFDRGLRLYNQGDYEGAVIEFQRAQALHPHSAVLFNIGLVQAKLGNSVESVRALEPLLKTPGSLDSQKFQLAKATYDEHHQRVGLLAVKTNVPKAVLSVDNAEVGPVEAAPLRLNAGNHVLSVIASGYEPKRTQVAIAGQTEQRVVIELTPLEASLAQLAITTTVPDVDIFAGAELIGTTPLVSSIAFKPGVHVLDFRRAGYKSVQRTVSLHPGSRGEVDVDLKVDPSATAATGTLALGIKESHAVVWVDGEPRLDYAKGMRLPVGKHQVRVERAGFHDLEREAMVRTSPTSIDVELFPTSEFLNDYVDTAESRRTLSWITMGTGAGIALAGAGFLLWNSGEKHSAEQAFDDYVAEIQAEPPETASANEESHLNLLYDGLLDARGRDKWGWLGVGVGAAGLVTGIVLYATGDDPEKYEPESDELDEYAGRSMRVMVGPTSAALQAEF